MRIDAPPGWPGNNEGDALATRGFDQILIEPLRWLWWNRIPLGKLSLLVGDPGGGKTLLACYVAATVSRGDCWPDGVQCEPGEALIASAEDDAGDTLRPRLEAAGADLHRVHFLDGKRSANGKVLPWGLDDFVALDCYFDEHRNVRAFIVDPLSAFMPRAIDSHKNAEVRTALSPVCQIAAKHGVAVIGITHLRKSEGAALYRAIGSLAFVAAARAAWLVAADREDEGRRLFLPLKANLAPRTTGLTFCIEAVPVSMGNAGVRTPRIAWQPGEVTMTADEALAPVDHREDAPSRSEAEDFLRQELRGGPVPAAEIRRLAAAQGVAVRSLARAKRRVGVVSRKGGLSGAWEWRLPVTDGRTPREGCQTARHQNVGTLRHASASFEDDDDVIAL